MKNDEIQSGVLIQHVSGTGEIFEIVKIRPEHGDALAVRLDTDPILTRIINPENWAFARIPEAAK